MKFLIDENLPPDLCGLFDSYGHTAKHVNDTTFSKDKHILRHAIKEGYIVVTSDIGFEKRIIGNSCGKDGLFIPPKMADVQLAIIPVYNNGSSGQVLAEARKIRGKLRYSYRTCVDESPANTPKWKYNYWTLRGAPLIMEVSDSHITLNRNFTLQRLPRLLPGRSLLGLDEQIEQHLRQERAGYYSSRNRGVKGLVMLRGFTKAPTDKSAESENKMRKSLEGMLRSMARLSFARAQLVDIRIDRGGTCFRIHDKAADGAIVLNEVREIRDFEPKLNYIQAHTGLSPYKIVEDQERVVKGEIVVNSHRNFLRAPLGYINKRISIAKAAGIDMTLEDNVTRAINKKDKQFSNWVRSASKEGLSSEIETLLAPKQPSGGAVQQNTKPPYILSNSSKRNKIR